ncbi:MAG: hypothetical protein IT376_06665 [Polyangiaceae bacterium]|nr:hypothetical protein [Polyangiaceae bacterium]
MSPSPLRSPSPRSSRSRSRRSSRRSSRLARAALTAGALVAAPLGGGAACLDRPVVGSSPKTTNVIVEQIPRSEVPRLDLLLVVDNSISMADKQALLARAVPGLVRRLVAPRCVDAEGRDLGDTPADPRVPCPSGAREFQAVRDLHVGVISSSLGGYGGEVCDTSAEEDDRGRLIGAVRPPPDPNGAYPMPAGVAWTEFLTWAPDAGGIAATSDLEAAVRAQVLAVGEGGCGYEAPLEAWYRFLVDPAPPLRAVKTARSTTDVERDEAGNPRVDEAVIAQRAAFLRPDSLVAIVLLTDENDCSLAVPGLSWLVGQEEGGVPRGTAACASDPNSPCCRSCGTVESAPPEGCGALADDPECRKGALGVAEDRRNARCFDQRRRFGLDLRHPVSRYVTALRVHELCPGSPYGDADCDCSAERARRAALCLPFDEASDCSARVGEAVPNPLFSDLTGHGAARPRDPANVYMAGIVGVPWQDIATEASLSGPGLTYLTARQLHAMDRWDVILGEPAEGRYPTDPFMVEHIDPRLAGGAPVAHPLLPGLATVPPGGTPNAVNGTEYEVPNRDDLQYACVYPLAEPRDCATATGGCDCKAGNPSTPTKPLCEGGTTLQTRAKAYPGLRVLNVLRDLGDNAIVASICPKDATGSPDDPGFGYTPALDGLVERLKDRLYAKCLPRKLQIDPATGEVACRIAESWAPAEDERCSCGVEGRAPASDAVAAAVRRQLRATGQCGGTPRGGCEDLCVCELPTPSAAAREACATDPRPVQDEVAWCYLEEGPLVAECPATERRLLRFVGTEATPTPRPGAVLTLACLGAGLSTGAASD